MDDTTLVGIDLGKRSFTCTVRIEKAEPYFAKS